MSAGNRGVSSLLIFLLAGLLCFGSYLLGLKHGAGSGEAGIADQRDGAHTAAVGPSVDTARNTRPLSSIEDASGLQAAEPVSTIPGRKEIETEQKQRLMRNLSENLALPGMSRIIRDQQRVLMTDQFRDLIETYGLNEEEREYFIDLLTARQMYHVDMGMKLMTGMLSEAERDELLKRVGAGIDQMNKEIDWFLNNETDSEYFDYYERTEGERAIVDAINTQLKQAGDPLGEGMDKELVAILHDEISAYPFSVQFEENGEPVFSRFTEDNINTFVREMQSLREPVLEEAAQVLDPQQLAVLADSFDQYVSFYDQRMRMVQQLFNPAQ